MRILSLLGYYLPGYKSGGPVRTVANMVERLGPGFEINVVTSDRDHGDAQPYANVPIDSWTDVGRARVFYASARHRSFLGLARLISETPHDVLYLNSFFDPKFTIGPLLARRVGLIGKRPTVIAPRGELSRGAIDLKKRKKAAFLRAAVFAGLYRDLTWQASSAHEAADIRDVLGGLAERVHVAQDLLPQQTDPSLSADLPREDGPLRICFVSRISPKKNLDFALRVVRRVGVPVSFDIYGPIEDAAYWRACEQLARDVGPAKAVRYRGSVDHGEILGVFSRYDLFFFPTKNENFGHVILESLTAGTPVLLSDTTPWRGLRGLGVGWDLPLGDEEPFAAAIETAARLGRDEYAAMRARAQAFARARLADDTTLEANRQMFLGLLPGHSHR